MIDETPDKLGLRKGAWLTVERRRLIQRLLACANVAVLVALLVGSHGGVDRNGFLLGTDFLSFWTTGRMLQAGADPYDVAAHVAAQRAFFAAPGAHTGFFYPPSFLPFCWPLGLVGYFPALAAWLAGTGALFLAAARAWFARFGARGPGVVVALAFPAALIGVTHGQTAFLVAGLLALGSLGVDRRPWLAGAAFGLATIKPQLGLLVPIVLVCSGQWRTILSAAVTAAALGLAAAAAFGPQVWARWWAVAPTANAGLVDGSIGFAKMQSVFAALRLLGAPAAIAWGAQGLVTLAVIASAAIVARRRGWSLALGAAMLAGAPLVTPFVLDYDLVLLAFPLILLACTPARPWERTVTAAAFAMPLFARPLGLALGLPVAPPVLLALYGLLLARAWMPPERADWRGSGNAVGQGA